MSVSAAPKKSIFHPMLMGILPMDASRVPADLIAGITLAALAIPEVMGYTKIAGMPVVTGLYTMLIPTAIFALFGSSRHLVVGADSATAAIMAAGLAGLAATASPEYVAYAGFLALLAMLFLILARIVRLGFIADFLSRTVLVGFLTGVGVHVAVGQIAGMLGLTGGGGDVLNKLSVDFQQLGQTNFISLGISLAVIALIIGARRVNKHLPGALIAVVSAILASYALNLSRYGVALLGPVPGGLPRIGLPAGFPFELSVLTRLIPIAFSMFIVILAQSAATSRAYATRYSEPFSENIDLIGLGLANLGAGLSGAFVVNGSPTKSQMVDSAGGRSQIAMLTTSFIVLVVLLFLTAPLAYMPEAVLAAVVFHIGTELINIRGMREIFQQRPWEFWVAAITALVVIFVGVEEGILLAILLSIFAHTRHGYKPRNAVLEVDGKGRLHMGPVSGHAQVMPGLVIYRFHHSLYYANAELLSKEVIELVSSAQPPVRWLCIDAIAVDDIDYTAAAALREIYAMLKERGVRLTLAEVDSAVQTELDRSGVTALVGNANIYETLADVQDAFEAFDIASRS